MGLSLNEITILLHKAEITSSHLPFPLPLEPKLIKKQNASADIIRNLGFEKCNCCHFRILRHKNDFLCFQKDCPMYLNELKCPFCREMPGLANDDD